MYGVSIYEMPFVVKVHPMAKARVIRFADSARKRPIASFSVVVYFHLDNLNELTAYDSVISATAEFTVLKTDIINQWINGYSGVEVRVPIRVENNPIEQNIRYHGTRTAKHSLAEDRRCSGYLSPDDSRRSPRNSRFR
jgi:hypothetical protein